MALTFGHLSGYPPGSEFRDRDALKSAGLHFRNQDGISWQAGKIGSDAIVLNGGYPDDEDHGATITYSGEGGRTGNRRTGPQFWTKGNLALRQSWETGKPVRVIRGPALRSRFRPAGVYRYDGLYEITDTGRRPGVDGFETCLFEFRRLEGDKPPWESGRPTTIGRRGPARQTTTIARRNVRDTKVTRWVKDLYADRCQICGQVLELKDAQYSEGAHIRPLGKMHHGPDQSDNVLCLCPNDHVRLDYGAIYLTDALRVVDRKTGQTLGKLDTAGKHKISLGHVRYHRRVIADWR